MERLELELGTAPLLLVCEFLLCHYVYLACTVVRMVIVHVCDYVYIQYAAITILTPTHYIHYTLIFTVPHNAPPFFRPPIIGALKTVL